MPFWFEKELTGVNPRSLGLFKSFTKSNGTTMARIYERLTRQSRRFQKFDSNDQFELMYRRGVYDTLKALQKELIA